MQEQRDQTAVKGTGFTMSPPVVDRPSSPEPLNKERLAPEGRAEKLEPLFNRNEAEDFRTDWHQIQGDFVDEPKRAVEQADKLVAAVVQKLTSGFANERKRLEEGWSKDGEVSTEDLRQALRKYRAFFDRLLSL